MQRVMLPAEVMQNLAQRDFSDIAVFNVDGKIMPQKVLKVRAGVKQHRIDLQFHEFDRFQKQRSKTVTTREQSQGDGTLSELATTETVAVESVRKTYLIELAADDTRRKYERIELKWRHEPASQVLQVRVEAGNELDNLRTISSRKSLTNRESEDIKWRSIRGVSSQHKYLRLTPVNDVDAFELIEVVGHYEETLPPPTVSVTVRPETERENGQAFYRIDVPSAISPGELRILPPEANSVLRGDLYLQFNNTEHKSPVSRGFRQHNLVADEVKPSKPLSLPRGFYHRIWFTLEQDLPAPPEAELIYPQYQVVFLGDGKGPYTLAWGNHEVAQAPPNLGDLVEAELHWRDSGSEPVTMLAIEEAGGSERLAPEPELPWQKWLLWAFLILAAAITARMVFKLYHEMNPPQNA